MYLASDEILLSVIIPTCNRNKTLLRAIYSVLNQHVSSIEIVVVNDTDKPIPDNILDSLNGKPIRFYTNTDRHGAASARNYGVNVAKGKYITFLDDDDVYLPGRLNNMLHFMKNDKYIMVSSGRFYENGDFISIASAVNRCFGDVTLKDIKYINDIDIGFMVERETFIKHDGFDVNYKSLEDWDFIIRVLMHGTCYKIERMDYVVNQDSNRPRVSDNDSESYLKMAESYRNVFGRQWYSYMYTFGLTLANKLTLIFSCYMAMKYFSLHPFLNYLRQIKRRIW